MIVRKEEFLALKQGPLSVSEYMDMFLQQSMPQQDKERHNKHQEAVVKPTTVER
jgi:hypothetical protein